MGPVPPDGARALPCLVLDAVADWGSRDLGGWDAPAFSTVDGPEARGAAEKVAAVEDLNRDR